MTILSDDLVEKAARAMYEARWSVTLRGDSEHGPEDTRNARAALEAALPGIVEEIAKVAEGKLLPGSTQYRGDGASDWSVTSVYGQGRGDAATAIRNLKPKEEGNG